MRPFVFVLPHSLIFWAAFIWSFAPERGILQRANAEAKKKDSKDGGSVRVLMAATMLATIVAFALADKTQIPMPAGGRLFMSYTGVVVLIAGSLLRRLCFRTLGQYFTGDVRARADQPVIQSGPYRWVRHPSYTAGMLMYLGIGVALTSWVSLSILMTGTIIGYAYRVRVEERALLSEIGAPYAEFMRTRKRFIPFVV